MELIEKEVVDAAKGSECLLIDGVSRPVHNSARQLIARSRQLQEEFWRTVGDKVLTDDAGRPRLLYHGTAAQFDDFHDRPTYCTADFGQARTYANNNAEAYGGKPRMVDVYVMTSGAKEVDTDYIEWAGYQDEAMARHAAEGHDVLFNASLSEVLLASGRQAIGASDIEKRLAAQISERTGMAMEDQIDIDGVMRHRKNSRGEVIAGTDKELAEFWRWFGNSAVVDAAGRPLVAYHNTHCSDIKAFLPHGQSFQNGDMTYDEVMQKVEKWRRDKEENVGFGYMGFRSGSFFTPSPHQYNGYGPNQYAVYIKADYPVIKDGNSATGAHPGMRRDALFMVHDGILNEIAVLLPEQVRLVSAPCKVMSYAEEKTADLAVDEAASAKRRKQRP